VTGKARQYINGVPLQTLASTRSHRHFGRKGFVVVVPADARPPVEPSPARHDDEAPGTGVTFDGRLPSIRHFRARWPPQSGRMADPAARPSGDCSLPAQLNPINLRHPSVSRRVRPVRPYAGAARVKIKANLSHLLRYQFPPTCRPDVGVYNLPWQIYRKFRPGDNISLLIEFKRQLMIGH